MRISDLSFAEFSNRIQADTISLDIGLITLSIHTSLTPLIKNLYLLYGDYPLSESNFADIHLNLIRPKNIRRYFRSQVLLLLDEQPILNPMPPECALPLFEWGLNWCIVRILHHYLILHAAVVEKNGHGLIITAPSGSGKSTLCAGLINNGWRLLSDELAIIDANNIQLTPLPRPVGLKNQSITLIHELNSNNKLSTTAHNTGKGSVAFLKPEKQHIINANTSVKASIILFPQYHPEAKLALIAKSKGLSMMETIKNSFNYGILGQQGFQIMRNLIDQCQTYDYHYRHLEEATDHLETLVT